MRESADIPLVRTIKERCRVCYTCVRECPAKAIRIVDGQAEVITERCIGCGNCVRVCGQQAKQVYDSIAEVEMLLSGGDAAAIVAPSFPAEFDDWDHRALVGALRALGFRYVVEVAAGADLVAEAYKGLLGKAGDKQYIATTCPAVVTYVERYYPELVDALAPIVSPMVAASRALKVLYGSETPVVFVGPCIAKKGEAKADRFSYDVDAVLTFQELRRMLHKGGLSPERVTWSEFDPPLAGRGRLFPVSRGLLQSAGIPENLATDEIVVADGRTRFVEAVKEFYSGFWHARLLEVMACEGCVMGPGIGDKGPLYRRKTRIGRYVRTRLASIDPEQLRRQQPLFEGLDLSRRFSPEDRRTPEPSFHELAAILERMGKYSAEDELNCGACGYATCREHAVAIYQGLAENEMCLPYTIERLRQTVQNLAVSKEKLAHTQQILVQAEKLASMGQLAAGIAHELNNPLGVVLMYAHMLLEEHAHDGPIREDLSLIAAQADRCKKIVAGLLHFARQNRLTLQETDIAQLTEGALRLIPVPNGVTVRFINELDDPLASVDRDQITQVLNNLVSNALQAMPQGGELVIRLWGDPDEIRVSVRDTGTGIPKEHFSKIFEPFFTTKAGEKGTGMGLAVSHGIVKMHRGNITVESNADPGSGPTGSTFTVTLPRHGAPQETLSRSSGNQDFPEMIE